MSFRKAAISAAALALAAFTSTGSASAADLPAKAVLKSPDLPFFLLIDDRVTYSHIFAAAQPCMWSLNADGSISAKTAKQVYSFTHFDIWGYGANFFTI